MKLWGGRFSEAPDDLLRKLNDSLHFDVRMVEEDIDGSVAWVGGLALAGLLTADEAATITAGLEAVRAEFADDSFVFDAGDEDIHTAVERRLTEIVGSVGGKLHTGRSRNDQVATDFRLWVMGAVEKVSAETLSLAHILMQSAADHTETALPGYTHLQHAQPITWAHWLLSHFWPLMRDMQRWAAVYKSADNMPLGSGALAGTAFPIDRQALASTLPFSKISENSLDSVSDRDFAADFLYAATMTGLHLSRLAEQLSIFNTTEFGFVQLDDRFTTGSSLMPQKKNPDTLELTRGKAGRLLGHLTGLLTTLKGLPSTYDKDMQEDKEGVFDAFDTLMLLLPVMGGVIATLQVNAERMAGQLEASLYATDLADYLVKKGMPFREAQHVVGAVVVSAETRHIAIDQLSLPDLQQISPVFAEDVMAAFTLSASLAARRATGGTAPDAVREQLAAAEAQLDHWKM